MKKYALFGITVRSWKGGILLNSLLLQFLVLCGVLYGFITFFIEIKKKSNRSKNQIGISIALIIAGIVGFLMTID